MHVGLDLCRFWRFLYRSALRRVAGEAGQHIGRARLVRHLRGDRLGRGRLLVSAHCFTWNIAHHALDGPLPARRQVIPGLAGHALAALALGGGLAQQSLALGGRHGGPARAGVAGYGSRRRASCGLTGFHPWNIGSSFGFICGCRYTTWPRRSHHWPGVGRSSCCAISGGGVTSGSGP